jgi:hypothetical protein
MSDARPDPTPAEIRRHWLAAQRLAGDDLPQQAALQAGLTVAKIRELTAEPDFQVARDAEAAILALDPAAWERRMEGLMRQAAERALVDGKVSTLNLLLRARLELPTVAAKARRPGARAAVQQAVARLDEATADDDEPDSDAWLAEIPVVETDPSRESLRRALLGMIEHPVLRQMAGQGPLEGVEQLVVCDDPVAYEEWFAKQPKVPFEPLDLPDSIRADIAAVTKHNPPWMRGEYLGYYRPPVPAHLFEAEAANDAEPLPQAPVSGPPAPASSIPALRSRVARLLDRGAPRLPEELDLAEAICAVKWPKWPEYQGPIDLALLRRALMGTVIDGATLNWLGGREIVRECRAGARPCA